MKYGSSDWDEYSRSSSGYTFCYDSFEANRGYLDWYFGRDEKEKLSIKTKGAFLEKTESLLFYYT